MLIGAQVSIVGGLDKSIDQAMKMGCTAIQTFASSPRTIKIPVIPQSSLDQYIFLRKNSDIKFHVFHGIYLINLAHEKWSYVQVCIEVLKNYQKLAQEIGALGTIFHVGSHKGKGLDAVIDQVATALKQILVESPPQVYLILENTAGQNGAIGSNFEELAKLRNKITASHGEVTQLAVGLDTQHAFGAGYDLTKPQELERLIQDIDRTWGLNQLKLIHLNDSAVACGSHRDRHANIGEGAIGIEGIKRIVHHPQLRELPFILEVPGKDKSGPRAEDVQQVINL